MTASTNVATAASLAQQLARLEAMQSLQASDINRIIVTANTSKFRGPMPSLTVMPTDPQWSAVLTAANQLLTSQIANLKTQLASLGVTGIT